MDSTMTDNRGPLIVPVIIMFFVLTSIFIPLRVYTRLRIIKAFALDDWLAVITQVLFTVLCVLGLVGVHWGVGHHMLDLESHERVTAMKIWFYCEIFYITSAAFLRLAVGTFLLRIALVRWHRHVLIVLNVLNVVFNFAYLMLCFLQCRPFDYFWTRADLAHQGHCLNQMTATASYVQCVLMTIFDYAFGLLPVLIIWDLHMCFRKKVVIGMILGMGILASTGTIIRFFYVHTLAHTWDFTYVTIDVAIWSFVETGLGLLCISLATLRPLLREIMIKLGYATACSNAPVLDNAKIQRKFFSLKDEENQVLHFETVPENLGIHSKVETAIAKLQPTKLAKGYAVLSVGAGRRSPAVDGDCKIAITKTTEVSRSSSPTTRPSVATYSVRTADSSFASTSDEKS